MFYKRTKNEETINALNNSLSHPDWSAVYSESYVDRAYEKFLQIFMLLYNKHCPVQQYVEEKKQVKSPWLTKGVINACKKKNNLLKTREAETRYKMYRNKLTDIRTNKQLYYRNLFYENKNNTKGTWDVLNSLIKPGRLKSTYPEYFIDKNGENYNMSSIVNSFNIFFVNIGPELAAEIPERQAKLTLKTILYHCSSLPLASRK